MHRTSAGILPHFRGVCSEGGFGVWWFYPPNPALAGNASPLGHALFCFRLFEGLARRVGLPALCSTVKPVLGGVAEPARGRRRVIIGAGWPAKLVFGQVVRACRARRPVSGSGWLGSGWGWSRVW